MRGAHAAKRAVAVLGRRGDVERVAGEAVADEFGVDAGAAPLGVLVLFEHDGAGALAHHEAVAIAVIGPRRRSGVSLKSGRQRAAGGKAGEPKCG